MTVREQNVYILLRGQFSAVFDGAAAIYIKHCFLGGAFLYYAQVERYVHLHYDLCDNAVIDVKRFGWECKMKK